MVTGRSPLFPLAYATNSSITPGQAPSSLQKLKVSSCIVFWKNSKVWFHISLLTVFVQFALRNSIHKLVQLVVVGGVPVIHGFPGALKIISQYTRAFSRGRAFWPCSLEQTNVCRYTFLNSAMSVDSCLS